MKAASKLRHIGKATAAAAVAAVVVAGIAPVAQAAWATEGGSIGIVDTNATLDGNQGATLLTPGAPGAQAMGDLVLTIPNQFQNGDTIDLALFDRTACPGGPTGVTSEVNQSADYKLVYSGTPTVTVDPKPYRTGTTVTTTTDPADQSLNAEYLNGRPVPYVGNLDTPTNVPSFNVSLVESSRNTGGTGPDVIRLTVKGTDNGNEAAVWRIRVSDLNVLVGKSLSPGSVRVVPFAYNGNPTTNPSVAGSEVFSGNLNDNPGTATLYDPVINTYTVPAVIRPVQFNVAGSNIINDGTAQNVGPITITESVPYAMDGGAYTLTIDGATIENTATEPVTVTLVSGSGQTVDALATAAGNVVTFNLNTDNATLADTSIATISVNGLRLSSTATGPVTYELAGGTRLEAFAGDPIGSGAAYTYLNSSGATVSVCAEADFGTVNQTDIARPANYLQVIGASRAPVTRIAGQNRYETAAKIAFQYGASDYVILASGQNYPDSLSGAYLSARLGGAPILLTTRDYLHPVTLNAIKTLGAKRVYILGSEGAISSEVENAIKGLTQYDPLWGPSGNLLDAGTNLPGTQMQVLRLGDSNRYGTNARINGYSVAIGSGTHTIGRTTPFVGQSSKATAFIVDGQLFPDAMSAGPFTRGSRINPSVSNAIPIIMTPGQASSLIDTAKKQLTMYDIEHVVIVGSTGAVSQAIEDEIKGMGLSVKRYGGATRYETNVLLNSWARRAVAPTADAAGGLAWDGDTAYLATGHNYPDALAAAPLVMLGWDGLFLTPTDYLYPAVAEFLRATPGFDYAIALGSGAVVSTHTLTQATEIVASNG